MRLMYAVLRSAYLLLLCASTVLFTPLSHALSYSPIEVNGSESAQSIQGNYVLWHDVSGQATLKDAQAAMQLGQFSSLESKGSTGLQAGAYWSYFTLQNTSNERITLHLEYIDHQLIYLDVFQRRTGATSYQQIAALSLNAPFEQRLVSHQRFVVPIELGPRESHSFLVRYGSDHKGIVFPALRLWQEDKLRYVQSLEQTSLFLLVGGLALMVLISLITGIATKDKAYYAYSLYAATKLLVWPTILGFTHMFLLREHFHWSYMSISASLSIVTGIVFCRVFLKTSINTPKLDKVMLLMIANGLALAGAAVFQQTEFAVIFITVAMLLYPVLAVAGAIRWMQGSSEAAVYTLAWLVLVAGLFAQALRDIGLVEHNFFSYYWPVLASYAEMAVMMLAMGLRLYHLRQKKEQAEIAIRQQLISAKKELERQVKLRTEQLEQAKSAAEREARTDPLTGIHNRRSFMALATEQLHLHQQRGQHYCLLMFDLDHFKAINDNHGHSCGDQALLTFAKAVNQEIREGDVFGRLGGEEFALCVSADQQTAINLAERLRKRVQSLYIDMGVVQVRFTTSIGIAVAQPEVGIEEWLNRADAALYQAKQTGRNRAVVA